MTRLLNILALLFAVGAVSAQDDGPPQPKIEVADEETSPRVDDEEARAIFDAARKAQFPAGKPGTVTSLEADLAFKIFNPTEKAKQAVGDTSQTVSVREGRFALRSRTTRDGRTVDQSIGYDDKCWLVEKDRRGARMRKRDYKNDIEELKSRKRRMQRLFKMFFLDDLELREGSLELIGRDVQIEYKIGRRTYPHKTDHVRLVEGADQVVELWIHSESRDVVKARIGQGPRADTFCLTNFAEVPMGGSKDKVVRVPHKTCFYEGDEPKLILSGDVGKIRVNALPEKTRAALFDSPKK